MEKWLVLLKDYTSVDLLALWALLPSPLATVVWTLIKITLIVAPLMGFVAYLTLIERKVIAAMQDRVGPDRVGPWGLLQPIADAFKVMFKEVLVPAKADRLIFWMAPLMARAYGSMRSLAGLKRWPWRGSYGPCTRKP